jgi:hypothetical protein
MTKLQITLTNPETQALSYLASRFGYDITRYVKYLISRTTEDVVCQIPTFPMSAKAEKAALKTLKEYEEGKIFRTTDFQEFFK